ncbi:fumarylacetoacetase [Oceaniovalibus sp. ACAM 378]|uniref:fumarylacetoacetase n=1 Tax=Oceaniovalibus sp. ACAM 378 TaxID=2599923 RepID=UPI0011DB00BA|nr:fumarylacetoacetase [Oceaniovalibus sp. ACAM 378]TYB89077.1 fumarylacetoacetase [Oceaniovalibus sp. ACAM 378]
MSGLNETHDPALRSWVESANGATTDFPIQNLPFGVISPNGVEDDRIAVAIGDSVLDLRACFRAGLLDGLAGDKSHAVFEARTLNGLMAQQPDVWSALRLCLSRGLREGATQQARLSPHLLAMNDIALKLPSRIGDFTDFYCSIEHATNGGKMSRPDNPLMPNFTSLPVGYNGRASSIVVSEVGIVRPRGQFSKDGKIVFGPTEMLDFELEVGAFIGAGNPQFRAIPLSEAPEHFFGICLLNDWSSRDVQSWEYQPLGPFLSKGFATTISGWVITQEALAPFRVPARPRDKEHGEALEYLRDANNDARGGLGLRLEVRLHSENMRQNAQPPEVITATGFDSMFWTIPQMITHHSSNGCPMRPGDLLGSGTVSQYGEKAQGCLSEITWRGTNPIQLENGETRAYLLDGDEVVMTGYCTAPGARRIGLGVCSGRVLASLPK